MPRLSEGILMNRIFPATLGAFLFLAAGCKSPVNDRDAIRDGVIKHIAGMNGLNLNNMTVTVTRATITGDKAQADVDIRAKNTDLNAPAMQLTYELQKQGADWVVLKGQGRGGMQHPTTGAPPSAGALPPGHPATGGAMPANHPDFNSILNSAEPPPQTESSTPPQPPAGSNP
jgi:hypothetical protein